MNVIQTDVGGVLKQLEDGEESACLKFNLSPFKIHNN